MRLVGLRRFALICLLFVLLSSGCSGREPQSINFLITWEAHSGRGAAIQKVVDAYNEAQDDYYVNLIGGSEDRSLYEQHLSDNDVAVMAIPYRYIQDDSIADQLQPLASINNDLEEDLSHYYDSLIDMSTNNDQVLGLPWIGHSMALVYNKTLLDELDEEPGEWKSTDDFLKGLARITDNSTASGIGLVGQNHHDITWMIPQFIYGFGGQLADDTLSDHHGILINSEASIDALDFYINGLGAYAQPNWSDHNGVDVLEAFAAEKVAFEIQGPWAVSDIWKRGNPFEIGVIPMSQIGLYSEVGPIMLSVPLACDNCEASMDFIHFMTGKKAMNMIMEGEYVPKYDAYYPFRVPIRKDMADSEFFKRYPEFYPFIQGFEYPSISTPTDVWASIQDTLVSEVFHKASSKEIAIEEALKEIEQCDPTY